MNYMIAFLAGAVTASAILVSGCNWLVGDPFIYVPGPDDSGDPVQFRRVPLEASTFDADGGPVQDAPGAPDTGPQDAQDAQDIQDAPDDSPTCRTPAVCGAINVQSPDSFCLVMPDGGMQPLPTPNICLACGTYNCACLTASWTPPADCAGSWGCSDALQGFANVRVTCGQ